MSKFTIDKSHFITGVLVLKKYSLYMGNFLLTFLILSVLLFVVGFAPFGNK